MAIHILYSETPIHLPTADIDNTKSHLDNLSYLQMLSSSSTAASTPLDTSNLCIEVFVRCHLHYWQAQEDLPIEAVCAGIQTIHVALKWWRKRRCCLLPTHLCLWYSGLWWSTRTRAITPITYCHLPLPPNARMHPHAKMAGSTKTFISLRFSFSGVKT